MRTTLARHSLIAAIVLIAAACGDKDKEGGTTAGGNATGNAAGAGGPTAAERLQAKVKAFNDQNGGCDECQPTEARVRVEMRVPHGLRATTATPSCMNEAHDTGAIRDVSDDAAALSGGQFAGAAEELLRNREVQRIIARRVGGDVGRVLGGGEDRSAYCQAVCAVLPKDSTVTGYKLEAGGQGRNFQTCAAGNDCAIGKAKWTAEPIPTTGENSKTVCGVFANWDHQRNRIARLSVYFTPPDDWIPPR